MCYSYWVDGAEKSCYLQIFICKCAEILKDICFGFFSFIFKTHIHSQIQSQKCKLGNMFCHSFPFCKIERKRDREGLRERVNKIE